MQGNRKREDDDREPAPGVVSFPSSASSQAVEVPRQGRPHTSVVATRNIIGSKVVRLHDPIGEALAQATEAWSIGKNPEALRRYLLRLVGFLEDK